MNIENEKLLETRVDLASGILDIHFQDWVKRFPNFQMFLCVMVPASPGEEGYVTVIGSPKDVIKLRLLLIEALKGVCQP